MAHCVLDFHSLLKPPQQTRPYMHASSMVLPEGVAGGDAGTQAVLQQPVGDLGQVGGLADAVDAHKDHDVWTALSLSGPDLAQDVDGAAGGEDARQGLLQRAGHHGGDTREAAQLLPLHLAGHRETEPATMCWFTA